jgi:hypothetical protein
MEFNYLIKIIYNTTINYMYNNFYTMYTQIQSFSDYYILYTNYKIEEFIILFLSSVALIFLTLYQKYQYKYEKTLSEYKYVIKNTINRKREIQNLKTAIKTKQENLDFYTAQYNDIINEIYALKDITHKLQNDITENCSIIDYDDMIKEIYILKDNLQDLIIKTTEKMNSSQYNKLKTLINYTIFTIKNSIHINEFEKIINTLENSIT